MNILLVCDETGFRQEYRPLIKDYECRLRRISGLEQVSAELQNERIPQIVIIDSIESSNDLAEFSAALRDLPNVENYYLIAVLDDSRQQNIEEFLQAGTDDCLIKPLNSKQFAERIKIAADVLLKKSQQVSLFEKTELSDLIWAAVANSDISMILTTAPENFIEPKIVFANAGFSKMTGYSAAEVLGRTPRIFQTAQSNYASLEQWLAEKNGSEVFNGSAVEYRKDGTAYDLEWQISPVRNELGEITHLLSIQHDVTLLKKSEHLLRESAQYQELFNFVNDPVIVFDPFSLEVLTVNNKACEVYRLSREDFIGQPLNRFWQDDSREKKMIKRLLADGTFEEFETVHYRSDKTTMHVLINSSLVEYEGRQAVLSIKRDVTERWRAEQNILRAKQEWSNTVDAVSDMIILEDSDGNLRRCNRAAQEHFSIPYTQLIGKPVADLIHRTNSASAVERGSKRDYSANIHLRQNSWEGQLFDEAVWYEITNHALPADKDEKLRWVHIVKNITRRRQAEAETQRLYTAIEQAADAVLITNLFGAIQYVNSSFERVTGWSRNEAVGRSISEVKESWNEDETTSEIFAILNRNEMWQKTYRSIRKNGEIFDEQVNASLVRNANGTPLNYVFVCRDVTEARRLESIAEAVNMMDNVGYIFSGIRHELGNPINSVKTALTVLRNNLDQWQPEQIKTYVERCLLETARVEYLLRTLKTFSMHENPQVQPVELNAYLENFVSLVREDFIRRGVIIRLISEENVNLALCDSRALHQVMLNLLANAADALENNAAPLITIATARLKNRIYVTIEDNGTGMNETQLNNLFKPFYTSKPEGTGLGLVIVRKMIVKMNGTIAIESQPNCGTKVEFTLEAVPE